MQRILFELRFYRKNQTLPKLKPTLKWTFTIINPNPATGRIRPKTDIAVIEHCQFVDRQYNLRSGEFFGGGGGGGADPIERTPLLSHFQKSSDFAGYPVL